MVTPSILAAVASVERVFDLHCTGGNLHIVIDDWNLEDDHLAICRSYLSRELSGDSPDLPLLAAEMDCLNLLEPMSEQERASVLAMHRGFTVEHDGDTTHINGAIDVDALALAVLDAAGNNAP